MEVLHPLEIVQRIISVCGAITGLVAVIALLWKLFSLVKHQSEQDKEIKKVRDDCKKDVDALRSEVNDRLDGLEQSYERYTRQTNTEQTLIIYGLLAALKGLKEQGCDGPVTEAIDKIEKHINQAAHR